VDKPQIHPAPVAFSDRRHPAYLFPAFAGCFLILAIGAVLILAFLDRDITFDEATLYNPTYMLLHYGRMIYPVHGHFDDMVVHPPTHYVILAMLMKLGLSLFHAAAIPPIVLFLIAGFVLLFSPFEFPVKLGLLFGTYLAAFVWTSVQTVRPDITLALAWIAGLITLESGRLAGWEPRRLFAGSALLCYAATLHYPASFCWTGVFVYAIWIWRSVPWRDARVPLLAIAGGLSIVGVPYLILFLIPFRHQIQEVIRQAQSEGGAATAFQRHVGAYRDYWNNRQLFFANQPLVQSLLVPLWRFRVPAALVGPPLLLGFKSTRGLALAALPQVLFMVFGARHKDTRFSGYFTPELILYLSAVISLAAAILLFLVNRIPSRFAAAALMLVSLGGFTAAVLHDRTMICGPVVRLTSDLDDLNLGRAAARNIAGPHAFIGSTSLGVWYTGGGADFYSISPELLYGPSVSVEPKKYFARFDGLAIDQLNSWVTWNKERVGLTSFYLSGDLGLKGFWFDDRRGNAESQLSWLMFSVHPGPVRGYAMRNGKMYRFDPSQDGQTVFFSAVCPSADLRNSGQFDFYLTLYFPQSTNDDPRFGPDSTPAIRSLLVSKEQFQREVAPSAAHCNIRDQIAGDLVQVDSAAMQSTLEATDRPIRFYRSFATALGGTGRLTTRNTGRNPGMISLREITAQNPQSHVSWHGTNLDIRTAPTRWWDAASVPIHHAPGVTEGFVYIRGRALAGVIGISIRGREVNSILGSEAIWGPGDGVDEIYIPVANAGEAQRVVIRNQGQAGQSEIRIEDAAFVQEKPAT